MSRRSQLSASFTALSDSHVLSTLCNITRRSFVSLVVNRRKPAVTGRGFYFHTFGAVKNKCDVNTTLTYHLLSSYDELASKLFLFTEAWSRVLLNVSLVFTLLQLCLWFLPILSEICVVLAAKCSIMSTT